jgi:hypothetical protein
MMASASEASSVPHQRHRGPVRQNDAVRNGKSHIETLQEPKEKHMTNRNKSLMMTAALGGLMLAATITTASAEEGTAAAGAGKTGECHGVNSCKGTGACHGAGNTCAGKNACKGQGWIKATKTDCEAKGGKFKE